MHRYSVLAAAPTTLLLLGLSSPTQAQPEGQRPTMPTVTPPTTLAPSSPTPAPPLTPATPPLTPATPPLTPRTPPLTPRTPPFTPPTPPLPTPPPTAPIPAPGAGSAFDLSGVPGQGVTATLGERFSLNLRSRLQLRYQVNVWADDSRAVEQFAGLGTARFFLSGNIYKPELTYLLQLALAGRDYRDGAVSPVYDAYLEWRPHRDISVRAGQFFVPFDRLRTVREWALQMADRPRVVQEFSLDRDAGVALFSEHFLGDESPLAWYAGAFSGRGTNQSAPSAAGGLLVGRLELRPLGPIDDDREGDLERHPAPRLALGAGVAKNFNASRLRSTTGPTFANGTTDDTLFAADLVVKWLGVALEAEYLWKRSHEDVLRGVGSDGADTTEYTHSGAGWVAQASYAFDPPVEVVARVSRMYAQSTLDAAFITAAQTRGAELGGGINYYFNGHKMKLQADWIALTDPDLSLSEVDHITHLLLDATF